MSEKKQSRSNPALILESGKVFEPSDESQYFYQVFAGQHEVKIEKGDSAFCLEANQSEASLFRGPKLIKSEIFTVVVRGYSPPEKWTALLLKGNLPYINGCSTRQLFPPERPGDPTWQLLQMPAKTSEQAHHVHPTDRAVYVIKGSGNCIYGAAGSSQKFSLKAGMTVILRSMCPHHFETDDEELIVLPVHIWSSPAHLDTQHPMYNGTLAIR